MLTATPHTRRAVLRFAGVATAGAVGAASLAACGSDDGTPTPDAPDPLVAQVDRARRDAALATAATATMPDLAGALNVVATERTAHADTLAAEVARADPPTSTPTTPTVSPDPVAPPTLDELRTRITDSASGAAALSRTLSGYRAGLLGSISAACTTQVAVLLR